MRPPVRGRGGEAGGEEEGCGMVADVVAIFVRR